MDKAIDLLKQWTIEYVKSRDVLNDQVSNIVSADDNLVHVKYDDRSRTFVLCPDQAQLDSLDLSKNVTLILLNNLGSLDFVLHNWSKLKKSITVNILFVNPRSKLEQRWALNPYTHAKIADVTSLKRGIITMSENVDYITMEELIRELS